MAKTVSVINQKGGVGKTTTAVNLSAAVGALGKRVLLADIDPQGNSTSGYGISKRNIENSTYDMLINGVKASEVVMKTKFRNVDLFRCIFQRPFDSRSQRDFSAYMKLRRPFRRFSRL